MLVGGADTLMRRIKENVDRRKGKERETTRKEKKEHKDRRSSTATVYTHIYIYT